MRTQKEILKKYLWVDDFYTNFVYDNHQLDTVKKTLRWVMGDSERSLHHNDMVELARKLKLLPKEKPKNTSTTSTDYY